MNLQMGLVLQWIGLKECGLENYRTLKVSQSASMSPLGGAVIGFPVFS
jgi:hypothetical protein